MKRLVTLATTLALMGAGLAFAPAVLAAAPANDNFAAATSIGALPFTDSVDTTTASTEAGEPQACSGSPRTVWYSITPASSGYLRVDPGGSTFYDTNVVVWEENASGFGGLAFLTCTTWFTQPITFYAQAGTTYYLQAGDTYSGGGTLSLNVQLMPPPANDNFAAATDISSLPFDQVIDASFSTTEAGEPKPSCGPVISPTVWFSFSGPTNGTMMASAQRYGYQFVLAVYTGDSLDSLHEVACGIGFLTFAGTAGTSYHLQVVASAPVEVGVQVAPPPNAAFYYYPPDPSSFDTIQFQDGSYDPAGIGISSRSWSFGDGTTSTQPSPQHQYKNDGDYTVALAVATSDGRSSSTSQVVHVATHDVAITKFTVPTSASVGQTRAVTVGISDTRYPETVQVELFKSTSSGFDAVGTLTQSVPVRASNRTTPFTFNYTFTNSDATIGKVTFQAVATIVGYRDALPGDNAATALPTKVTK